MKNPLGVCPSKGNQGTTQDQRENYFDLGGNRTHVLRIRTTVALATKLRGRTENVGDDFGGESREENIHMTKIELALIPDLRTGHKVQGDCFSVAHPRVI